MEKKPFNDKCFWVEGGLCYNETKGFKRIKLHGDSVATISDKKCEYPCKFHESKRLRMALFGLQFAVSKGAITTQQIVDAVGKEAILNMKI
jgi:hypothetical protein